MENKAITGYIPTNVIYYTSFDQGYGSDYLAPTVALRGTKSNQKKIFNRHDGPANPVVELCKNDVFIEARFVRTAGSRQEPEFIIEIDGKEVAVDGHFMGEVAQFAEIRNGVIYGAFQWLLVNKIHVLACVDGPRHIELVMNGDVEVDTKRPLTMKVLVPGTIYKNRSNNRYVFMGTVDYEVSSQVVFVDAEYDWDTGRKFNAAGFLRNCKSRHNVHLGSRTLYNKAGQITEKQLAQGRASILRECFQTCEEAKWLN